MVAGQGGLVRLADTEPPPYTVTDPDAGMPPLPAYFVDHTLPPYTTANPGSANPGSVTPAGTQAGTQAGIPAGTAAGSVPAGGSVPVAGAGVVAASGVKPAWSPGGDQGPGSLVAEVSAPVGSVAGRPVVAAGIAAVAGAEPVAGTTTGGKEQDDQAVVVRPVRRRAGPPLISGLEQAGQISQLWSMLSPDEVEVLLGEGRRIVGRYVRRPPLFIEKPDQENIDYDNIVRLVAHRYYQQRYGLPEHAEGPEELAARLARETSRPLIEHERQGLRGGAPAGRGARRAGAGGVAGES
ncbi:hypothetical protein ABZV40_46400, partial [Lentzea sp. NPDC004782]